MSEEKMVGILGEFREAYVSKNIEKMLSFLTEDVVWVTAMGTFRGKNDVKRYFDWDAKVTPGLSLRDIGSGLVVKGNRGFAEVATEWMISDHEKVGMPVMFAFDLNNDKIQQVRVYYDRLSIAKQVAKGGMEKMAVDGIVNSMEKGLNT